MNLTIDIGNTRAKLAIFDHKEILETTVCFKENIRKNLVQLRQKYPEIENGILANVAQPEAESLEGLHKLPGKKIKLATTTPIPFKNAYQSQKTLGLDRIALAAAAINANPGKDTLVIDAGTCITYDLITQEKTYRGGAISPGLNMRYRALNNFTANLPLLRSGSEINIGDIGRNTTESLQLGVTMGLSYEMDGFMDRYRQAYENLTIILTGGDYEILSKRLKNSIFVHRNFLLTGLNCILEYNLND